MVSDSEVQHDPSSFPLILLTYLQKLPLPSSPLPLDYPNQVCHLFLARTLIDALGFAFL